MAVAAANAGFRVIGLDSSERRVKEITRGVGLNTVTESRLDEALNGGLLHIRKTSVVMPKARTYMVCVPTPPGEHLGADLSSLLSAIDMIGVRLSREDLVLIQSTCPPGTLDEVVAPRLTAQCGLQPGVDFSLAYSPVRISPGRASAQTAPRLVSGVTARCAKNAGNFLDALKEQVIPVADSRVVELAKVFENAFRLVNISLVNELAKVCELAKIDVSDVLSAAETKPYGYLGHQPSVGAGGACVPLSAQMLSAMARKCGTVASITETALKVNEEMCSRTIHRVRTLLDERRLPPLSDCRVLVLGITYKPDVADVRQSAAVRVLEQLRMEAKVTYHDPYVPRLELDDGTVLSSAPCEPESVDLVILITKHQVLDADALANCGTPVVDCSSGYPMLG